MLAVIAVLGLSPGLRPHILRSEVSRPQILLSAAAGPPESKSLWSRYTLAAEQHQMTTKMATAFVLACAGDAIAQRIEGIAALSLRRMLVLGGVNVVYIVPILTFFYAVNEKLAARLKLEPGTKRTLVQLAFDQLVNAPIVVAGFYVAFGLASAVASGSLASFSAAAIAAKLRAEYVLTIVSNWKVWVLPQLLNFAIVPVNLRVPFANLVGLVWTVILSILANR